MGNISYDVTNLNKLTSSYDVAGLFIFTDLILAAVDFLKKKYDFTIPLVCIYGAPANTIWNGGRYLRKSYTSFKVETELQKLSNANIKPCFTLTNNHLSDDDLKETVGNQLLEASEILFGSYYVRTTSKLLEDYISAHYQRAILLPSVISIDLDNCVGSLEYYKHLSSQYSRFVVHPFDNFNDNIFSNVDCSRAEVMLNEACSPSCKNRSRHYEMIADEARGDVDTELHKTVRTECPIVDSMHKCCARIPNACVPISRVEQLESEYGVRHFKLQGRCDNIYSYFFDFMRYTLRDEYLVAQLYSPFCDVIAKWLKDNNRDERLKVRS
jgi:hypothetical protein